MSYEKDPNELGCLWERESARGTYFTGMIGDQKIVVFKNTNKKSDKAPDWRILRSVPKDERAASTQRLDTREAPRRESRVDDINDIDVPF